MQYQGVIPHFPDSKLAILLKHPKTGLNPLLGHDTATAQITSLRLS
jgi:hypothetical protein